MEPDKTNEKIVHTLSQDIGDALSSNTDGVVRKIIKEQEEKESEKKNIIKYSKKNRIYIFLTVFFILLSLVIGLFIYFKNQGNSFLFKQKFTPLIYHENTKIIDVEEETKDSLSKLISDEVVNLDQKQGYIEGIYLRENKNSVGLIQFLKILESETILEKNKVFGDNFLIGAIKSSLTKEEEEEELKRKSISLTPKKILDDFITLSTSAFFKTGTTEFVDAEAKEKAKVLIGYFLDTITFETSKIKVIGTYSVERPWEKNEELAEARKKFALDILLEVLKEKYTEEEIAKVYIESVSKGLSLDDIFTPEEIAEMTEEEKNLKIDLNQGIQYLVEARKKPIEEIRIEEAEEEEEVDTKLSVFPTGNDLFILLKINRYEDAFKKMRSWEEKLFYDLHNIFGIDITSKNSYLLTKEFEDGIVQNKNARILYDKKGKIVLMYVYIDDEHLIITNTEKTTREVILRINSSKIKK